MRIFYAAIETDKSSDEELTSAEFNTLLEYKFNFIKSLISKFNDLQEQEKDEEPLLILCANFRKEHCLGNYPLSSLEVCEICEDGHAIKHFPSMP